jgi:hypothetical protein
MKFPCIAKGQASVQNFGSETAKENTTWDDLVTDCWIILQAGNCRATHSSLVHLRSIISERVRLNNFLNLSSSSEAASCATTQELPSILWNPMVYYNVLESPPLVPILSQINQIHTTPSYLSEIYFNIIHPPSSCHS